MRGGGAQLYLMALLLVLLVGAMVYARRAAAPPPKEAVVSIRPPRPPAPEAALATRPAARFAPLPADGQIPWKALAAPFKDGTGPIIEESPEFLFVLSAFLRAVTPGAIATAARPGLSADAAYLHPAEHRGHVLRVYGRLIRTYTEGLEGQAGAVTLAILQEYQTNRTVWVYLPGVPCGADGKPIPFRKTTFRGEEFLEDWVEFEGLFLRQYAYPSLAEGGQGEPVEARAAVLFAKDLRLSRPPQVRDWRAWSAAGVTVAVFLVLAILLVAVVMSRRYGSGSLRVKVREMRRAAGKEEPPPAFRPREPLLGNEVPRAPVPPPDS